MWIHNARTQIQKVIFHSKTGFKRSFHRFLVYKNKFGRIETWIFNLKLSLIAFAKPNMIQIYTFFVLFEAVSCIMMCVYRITTGMRTHISPNFKQTNENFENDAYPTNQKRFYTRGTLRGIRISRMAKIITLYRDWLRSLN